jgi:hypothetical protein
MDLPPELPPKFCLQGFAHVLNRLFHALHYRSRIFTRSVKAGMPHQILWCVGVPDLRRYLNRKLVSQFLRGEFDATWIVLFLQFLQCCH